MEEKKVKVAKNLSSGAEKVERIEKTVQEKPKKNTATQKVSVKKKVEKENENAKARVDAALKKKKTRKEKAKRTAAERKAMAEKRKAERKARMEKKKAERKARAEKRRAEYKARIEKMRANRKAYAQKSLEDAENVQREHAHKKAQRNQQRAKRGNREKGYGGWLAAVISLGAVTLGLTTVVAVGAMEMRDNNNAAMTGIQSTTYELIGIMEHVDNDLDRARIAASSSQQQRILTDLLVQARLAELDLEKLPIDGETDRNVTTFINRLGAESEKMLAKLRRGESLSKEDEATLQRLYEINHAMRLRLDDYAANMTKKDVMGFMKKGEGAFSDMLKGLEDMTLEENRAAKDGKTDHKGVEEKMRSIKESGSPKIDTAQAEELCKRYFADYNIAEFQCVGETVSAGYAAYNVQGYDAKGTLLFAEIDYEGGELIRFDYYEPCESMVLDNQSAEMVAKNFLEKLGYEDMTAVRTRENGTDADFHFVYENDGVVYYPDTVRVKVCRSRGIVTGLDATQYLQNHENRAEIQTGITMEQAQEKLHDGLAVEYARLVVVKAKGGERAAYEFLCRYMDEQYLLYTDAMNGDEIAILNLKNL